MIKLADFSEKTITEGKADDGNYYYVVVDVSRQDGTYFGLKCFKEKINDDPECYDSYSDYQCYLNEIMVYSRWTNDFNNVKREISKILNS